MQNPEQSEENAMPPSKNTRFDFAKPSAHVTRAIVIRGKGRFSIVRPEREPSAIISRKAIPSSGEALLPRPGGLPLDGNAANEFEAGMHFGKERAD